MAYEPKEWACGDVVTADALNHLEGGVEQANSILPEVTASDNGKVLGVSNGEYTLVEGGGSETIPADALLWNVEFADSSLATRYSTYRYPVTPLTINGELSGNVTAYIGYTNSNEYHLAVINAEVKTNQMMWMQNVPNSVLLSNFDVFIMENNETNRQSLFVNVSDAEEKAFLMSALTNFTHLLVYNPNTIKSASAKITLRKR